MLSLQSKGLVAITILIAIFIAGHALAADTVNIVMPKPLSGPFKEAGEREVWGTQFAIDEINASGGLLGKQVKLIAEDCEFKPDIAVRKATRAILEDKAQFIFQWGSTALALALMDVAAKHKVVFVSCGGTGDYLTGKYFNRYFFRACLNMTNFSRSYAEFFKTKPWRKFYLFNPDFASGHEFARALKLVLKKEIPDAEIVGEDFHPLGTNDFGPYIPKILASGAEVIFTASFVKDLEVMIKQGAQMGVKARYAAIYLDHDTVLSNVGKAAVGSFENSMYLPTIDTPENKAFVQRWHQKFKDTKHPWPNGNQGTCPIAAKLLFEAIKKAKSFDSEAVIKAFEGMESDSVYGKVVMRACDHQLIRPAFIAEIQAKSTFYPHPFAGTPVMIPRDKVAIPISEAENPRCIK